MHRPVATSRVERRPPERAANFARSRPPRWPMMARPAPSPSREPLMAAASPSTTVLDSILFRDAFGTPQMRAVFSDRALIGRYIEVEIALARAEARCGVIPAAAAEAIARGCDLDPLDIDLLRRETDNVG